MATFKGVLLQSRFDKQWAVAGEKGGVRREALGDRMVQWESSSKRGLMNAEKAKGEHGWRPPHKK